MNSAVTEMDKVTQATSANAEESAAAAEELNAQAEQMKVYVDDLVMVVGGGASGNGRQGGHAEAGRGVRREQMPARKALALPARTAGKTPAARGKASPKARGCNPEEVIPMNDGEFKDF